ncbi:MAG: hypothetical protein LW650_10170 [Planctomycetaceae bacterium]|nr:hypothetical protein [Planctomycetaceae bacterium]
MLDRQDIGTIAQKVFSLRHGTAANVAEIIKPSIPDYAKIAMDPESNQVLVSGPIALLQRIERVITSLDKPASAALISETFKLRFADAEAIAQNIRDLFSDNPQAQAAQRRNTSQAAARQLQAAFGGGQGGDRRANQQQQGGNQGSAAPTANLRVTSNTQQNSVTVVAEQAVLDQVRTLIDREWDKPLPEEAVTPRVFDLKHTDPVKMKDVLEGLFGQGSQATVGSQGGQRSTVLQQGVGRLAGQFSFSAIPEAGRLIVVAKSPDNIAVIESVIQELDRPIASLVPETVELKHATAEELAEQVNALLAQEGTFAQIRRTSSELAVSQSSRSPFSSQAEAATDSEAQQSQQGGTTGDLRFWWQTARVPTDTAGTSNLVGKVRVVPVSRRNALLVMAPQEYKRAVVDLIEKLDKPNRQVLIAAVIAEISGEDATALGLRFSQSGITPTRSDNTVGFGGTRNAQGNVTQPITGTKNDLLPGLFDTSVLNVGVDLNVLLQALAQNTKVTILSEPRIFTGDNQQAEFFDGQDIPFITDTQTSTGDAGLVQSFDYKAVGIALRVRPRITPERDVDLKVNLELSSIDPSRTLFGGAIIERRETTTQLIVQDGQTVVISGIMRSEDSDVKRKVPLLGDIPLVGALFTNIERTKTNTELVAFITPVVVTNEREMQRLNEQPNIRLNQLRNQLAPERQMTDPSAAPGAPTAPNAPAPAPKRPDPLPPGE